jgi:hypothetical protein
MSAQSGTTTSNAEHNASLFVLRWADPKKYSGNQLHGVEGNKGREIAEQITYTDEVNIDCCDSRVVESKVREYAKHSGG